jgi:hypothetical protein
VAVQYLFNSNVEWIAFRVEKMIYDVDGNWIGWIPWYDNDIVRSDDGSYLGTIVEPDRIFHFLGRPYRGYPGYPGYPGIRGRVSLPSNARDVIISTDDSDDDS